MNRKISSNVSIILLLLILGLSYAYMSLPDNFRVGMRGGAPEIPPECIPFMYKFRYLFYFFFIFMIIFVIREYYVFTTISQYSYSDYMTKFLQMYSADTQAIKNKTITSDEQTNYNNLISAFQDSGEYGAYGNAFCKILSPCNCCNEPGYYNPNCPSGTVGAKPPSTLTPS